MVDDTWSELRTFESIPTITNVSNLNVMDVATNYREICMKTDPRALWALPNMMLKVNPNRSRKS